MGLQEQIGMNPCLSLKTVVPKASPCQSNSRSPQGKSHFLSRLALSLTIRSPESATQYFRMSRGADLGPEQNLPVRICSMHGAPLCCLFAGIQTTVLVHCLKIIICICIDSPVESTVPNYWSAIGQFWQVCPIEHRSRERTL